MRNLDDFPFQMRLPVTWGEMDAFGHVNNTVYFRYFETARIKYFEEIGLGEMLSGSGLGPILAETSCKYLKPLFYPDNLTIGTRVAAMGTSSIVMDHILVSAKVGLAAYGQAVVVVYDYDRAGKAPIPEHVKSAIMGLEGEAWDQRGGK